MPVQLNLDWNRIRKEINRLSDLNVLKSEVQKVRDEVRKFDYQSYLSPTAQKKVKDFEQRYNKLMKTVGSAQRQLDREFNKLIRQVQKHRENAEDGMDLLKKMAEDQKTKMEKATKGLFGKTSKKTKTKKKTKKKTAAKKTARKKKKA